MNGFTAMFDSSTEHMLDMVYMFTFVHMWLTSTPSIDFNTGGKSPNPKS